MTKLLNLLLPLLLLGCPARAQRENSNWFFGNRAAISFPAGGGAPVPVAGSSMASFEACASISDGSGQLLFYSDGSTVWNRYHQAMANGTRLGGNNSATQGAAIARSPDPTSQYYLFGVDTSEFYLQGGLWYSVVDMSLAGGLGDVTARHVQLSTPGLKVTEKLTTVPHANGRDTWVLVHGWDSSTFYAYLLAPGGVQPTPVTSSVGAVHTGGGGFYGNLNSIGYLRASPDGTRLALAINNERLEVFDFDPATGRVANALPLASMPLCYGVEFSPDGRLLYGGVFNTNRLYQFDLQAGSAAAVASSGQVVATTTYSPGSIQAGPDGKLYVSTFGSQYLSVIDNPNGRGTSCGFRANGLYLPGASCQYGLPNYSVSKVVPVALVPAFTATTACAGTATSFVGSYTPAGSVATATWSFGDPAPGAANVATGLTATHAYAQPGTYQATLTVTHPLLAVPAVVTRAVTVLPVPAPRLPADTLACGGPVLLRPRGSWPAGSTFRWPDGSTAATYPAPASGTYTVQVTSPAGCVGQAATRLTLSAAPAVSLGADTLVCPLASWVLRPTPQPAGTTYRWQDGSTNPTYTAASPGTYAVEVRTPAGCQATATRVVTGQSCPLLIPNILTPNGDGLNDYFVLKGLTAANWQLTVFNRWGRPVYEQARYDNGWHAAGQPAGLYYYLLRQTTTGQLLRGWVEVQRPD